MRKQNSKRLVPRLAEGTGHGEDGGAPCLRGRGVEGCWLKDGDGPEKSGGGYRHRLEGIGATAGHGRPVGRADEGTTRRGVNIGDA